MTGTTVEFLTLDIIGHFGFNEQLDMLEAPDNRCIIPTLHSFSWTMGVYEQMPILRHLKVDRLAQILLGWTRARRNWVSWSGTFASNMFDSSGHSSAKGLFGIILDSKNDQGESPSEAELRAEGSFLMLAGTYR